MDDSLSLVLFSGTDDKLNAAAVLTAGAAAMGRKVHVFLQYWALDAFRADRVLKDHGVAPGWSGRRCGLPASGGLHWARSFAKPRTSGRSRSRPARCRWRCSGLEVGDLDPLVDGQEESRGSSCTPTAR